MNNSRLPDFVQQLVGACIREDLSDTILGDLEELYERRIETHGIRRASFMLILDTLFFFRPFALKSIFKNSNNAIMLSNHLKISFRKIRKFRGSSLAKMMSLSVGMVSVFFISLYIHQESSFDHFHRKRHRIYTLNTTVTSPTGDLNLGLTATGVVPYLKVSSPAIEEGVRINRAYGSHVIKHGDKQFIEAENILFADAAFFKLFDFDLIDGSPEGILDEPLEIVLSARAALKYFDKTQVVGMNLEMDEHTYTVSGVVDDIPHNSHLQFDFLVSMETFLTPRPNAPDNWTWMPMNGFLLLKESAEIAELEEIVAAIPAYQEGNGAAGYQVSLEPFTGIHFSKITLGKLESSGNEQNLYILGGIGVMILLLAAFNYINLTTATISLQQKEVSLKKTIGASQKHVFGQFFMESGVITGISTVLASGLIVILFPKYEYFLQTTYGLDYLWSLEPLSIMLVMPIILTLVGGLYPAWKFSALTVGQMEKKPVGRNYWFDTRSSLLVFQFGITSALIIGSLVIYSQLQFIKNQELGIDLQQRLVIDFGPMASIGSQHEVLSAQLKEVPGITDVTFSSHVPGEEPNGVTTVLRDPEGNERTGDINLTLVDPNFISRYGLEIIAGRDFRNGPADVTSSLIVNEACARAYGFTNPEDIIGYSVQQWGGDGKVIGVVNDFNYLSLHSEVGLLSLKIWPEQFQKATIKLETNDIPGVIADLEMKWNTLYPNIPFNYFFLDDNFGEQYRQDDLFMKIINLFSMIAVFIGVLGLISYTSFWVDRKQREMSIRKVLGAQVNQLLWQFYKQFTLPVLMGFMLAVPFAYYFGNDWISQFAYQFQWTPLTFLMPVLLILVLVSIIIGLQTFRVIDDNPINHLKEE